MSKQFRVGVLGLTHDHIWSNLEELQQTANGRLVAAADPNPPLLEKVKQLHGCNTYPSYEAMLDQEQLDAVYIYSDNATGTQLVEMAAARGLHMMIEKPLAATLHGADRAVAAARRAGVQLMVNWPFAWWPQLQHALRLAEQGDLGDLWQVKYRAAHAGPKELGCTPYFYSWLYDRNLNGGGALIDYCCYGVALARILLGMPGKVSGVAGRLRKEDMCVEDNAVLLLSYPQALALAEASWTQIGKLTSYIAVLYGSRGTFLVEPRKNGRLLHATEEHADGIEVKVPQPGAHDRSASAHFLYCLQTQSPFTALCNDRIGRDAQEILQAGLLAIEEERHVSLPLTRLLFA